MKILHLNLKKKWFDMIASGEKKEEYREIKPHWIQRLTWHEYHTAGHIELIHALASGAAIRQDFDAIQFKNGYSKDAPTMLVELKHIHYGVIKRTNWADAGWGNWFFCLELGEILEVENIKNS